MYLIGKAFVISVVIAIASIGVFACDCLDKSATESYANSDVVFIGEVISVDSLASTATFEVHRQFKGAKTDKVVVFSGLTDCDMWFQPQSTYMVFAKEFEGRLRAPSCYATKAIGPPRFESRFVLLGSDVVTEQGRNYAEIALVTITCVAVSLGVGFLVGAIRKRFR